MVGESVDDRSFAERRLSSEEEDVLMADGAGWPDPLTRARMPGPSNLAELFRWSTFCLSQLAHCLPSCFAELQQKRINGVSLYTDWSGMGCPEMAIRMISEALELMGERPLDYSCARASDLSPLCIRALLSHSVGAGPAHVFGDIMLRIPKAIHEELQRLTAQAQQKLIRASGGKQSKINTEARDSIGQELVFSLCHVLEQVDWKPQPAQHCYRHECECPIWGSLDPLPDSILKLSVVGNECLDWTSFGKHFGECGSGLMVLLAWCHEMLALGIDVIIQECTPLFRLWILEYVFVIKTGGRYRVQARTFSPVDLGIPASRPRQYVIITHVKFNILLPFDGAAFEDILFRTFAVVRLYLL